MRHKQVLQLQKVLDKSPSKTAGSVAQYWSNRLLGSNYPVDNGGILRDPMLLTAGAGAGILGGIALARKFKNQGRVPTPSQLQLLKKRQQEFNQALAGEGTTPALKLASIVIDQACDKVTEKRAFWEYYLPAALLGGTAVYGMSYPRLLSRDPNFIKAKAMERARARMRAVKPPTVQVVLPQPGETPEKLKGLSTTSEDVVPLPVKTAALSQLDTLDMLAAFSHSLYQAGAIAPEHKSTVDELVKVATQRYTNTTKTAGTKLALSVDELNGILDNPNAQPQLVDFINKLLATSPDIKQLGSTAEEIIGSLKSKLNIPFVGSMVASEITKQLDAHPELAQSVDQLKSAAGGAPPPANAGGGEAPPQQPGQPQQAPPSQDRGAVMNYIMGKTPMELASMLGGAVGMASDHPFLGLLGLAAGAFGSQVIDFMAQKYPDQPWLQQMNKFMKDTSLDKLLDQHAQQNQQNPQNTNNVAPPNPPAPPAPQPPAQPHPVPKPPQQEPQQQAPQAPGEASSPETGNEQLQPASPPEAPKPGAPVPPPAPTPAPAATPPAPPAAPAAPAPPTPPVSDASSGEVPGPVAPPSAPSVLPSMPSAPGVTPAPLSIPKPPSIPGASAGSHGASLGMRQMTGEAPPASAGAVKAPAPVTAPSPVKLTAAPVGVTGLTGK